LAAKDNYITCIKKGGFDTIEVLDEKVYAEEIRLITKGVPVW
jgi:hypothetical protein